MHWSFGQGMLAKVLEGGCTVLTSTVSRVFLHIMQFPYVRHRKAVKNHNGVFHAFLSDIECPLVDPCVKGFTSFRESNKDGQWCPQARDIRDLRAKLSCGMCFHTIDNEVSSWETKGLPTWKYSSAGS